MPATPPLPATPAALRPLSRGWRWAIVFYAAAVALGVALALLMSGGPGSGRLAQVVAVLQEPYLQLLSGYRGQDDTLPYVEFVVFESENEREQGLQAYLQGRQDIRFQEKGLLPGVSVVRIRREGLAASLDDLKRQPFANMVLKSRVGMFCH